MDNSQQIPEFNVDDLLFFPGKELGDVNMTGRRMGHRPIRIAIGVDGVFKFDPNEDKVMCFWGYYDIQDWSYSGYSFTLNFKSKVDYHVRTNDGPSISYWIETFSKTPDQAMVAAKQFKSLGDQPTTDFRPINKQPVFYTLNTRKKHNRTTEQSRMLSAYGVDRKHGSTQAINTQPPPVSKNDLKRWSTGHSMAGTEKHVTSTDVLAKSNNSSDYRAKSLEFLPNGNQPTSPVLSIPAHSVVNHSNGAVTHNQEPPPSDELPGSPCMDNDEEPPLVPPRNTSLYPKSVRQTTPPKQTRPEHQVLIKVSDTELSQNSSPTKPRPHTYDEIEIGVPSQTPYSKIEVSPNDSHSSSGDYDHLFPGKKQHKDVVRKKKSKDKTGEEETVFTSIRRNVSMPPMVIHSPLVQKHNVTPKEEESGLSDSEMDEPISPLPGEYRSEEGVVLRSKSTSSSSPDPFADLLSAPPNKSRLRWSQELNPLYDYIRGVKISPKIGYESLATTPENIIREEDDLSTPGGDETASITSSERRSSSDSQFDGLIFVPQSAPNTLQRVKRKPHNYDEVTIGELGPSRPDDFDGGRMRSGSGGSSRPLSEHYSHAEEAGVNKRSQTFRSSPLRRLKSSETPFAVSPQLNKRVIHRKSKTVRASDDTNAPHGRQHAHRVADTMRDFSYITREYRVFFIKLPSGHLISEVVNINKPVSTLIDKLAELLGACTTENYSLFVEGAVLTTMKEATLEFGELQPAKAQVGRSVSLTQLVDNTSLADQGEVPILLKSSLSFRMQGITTARVLKLDDSDDNVVTDYNDHAESIKSRFHKAWLSVVQGNLPVTVESAVKLAAMQYQAYFLERTAQNSVVGFCQPTEFLPAEFAGVRGIEPKIYKEHEKIKANSQSHIQKAYVDYCNSLQTSNTLFFPVREARRRLLQGAKLKPVLLGINKRGIMRLCPKTKEVLELWEYQVLKNWAYSRRTFVVAFSDKNYPVESNQAKWISDLVDFFVDSIVQSSTPPRSTK